MTKTAKKQPIETGQFFMTAGISRAIANSSLFSRFVLGSYGQHKYGDWGDRRTPDVNRDECLGDIQGREPLSGWEADIPWDHQINDYNVIHGGRIISSYKIPPYLRISHGQRPQTHIWIITEACRSYTTALFPSEY